MSANRLNVVTMKIADLKAYENNPRKNEKAVDAVANSINSFGFKVPVIIDKNNVVVAGHTRLMACKKLGIEEVPCVIADDLTEDQIKAFRIADNKTAELADWDFDKLKEELGSIEIDMEQFEFTDLEKIMDREVMEDEFDENEALPENPYAKKGDVFILGKHRVMCGDATIKEDVLKLVDGKIADMIFTDPPYNVDYEGANGMKIQNDKQNDADFKDFLFKSFKNMAEVTKPGGSIYCCHADTEGLNFRRAFIDAGFKLAECLVWVKNSLVLGRQDYHWRHEPILYGWKEGGSHYFIEDRTQDTVWEYNKPKANDLHPTMKPLELVGRAIKNSSRKDNLVLDLFGGSGSTLIAAEQIQRSAYLMEIDERYVDVIVKRYLRFVQGYENSYLLRNGEKFSLKDIADYHIEEDEKVL
ncbi:MAG: DNA modification methylase [Candidatus Cloacimonetes bacterium]|nr:DNA modification methylase [Candidatus Cloacimonadota bacterium]